MGPAPNLQGAVLIIRLFISHAIAVPRHHQRRHHHRRLCDVFIVVVFLLSCVCTFTCFHPSQFPNFVRGFFVDDNITVPLPTATTTTKEKANNCNCCD
jgi:hypothetical protein